MRIRSVTRFGDHLLILSESGTLYRSHVFNPESIDLRVLIEPLYPVDEDDEDPEPPPKPLGGA